jgi:tripeptide aminopeptidase
LISPRLLEPDRGRLTELFLELTAIPSPSGCEAAVAARVGTELRSMDLVVREDGAGKAIGGDSGNLLAIVQGEGPSDRPFVALGAHLDTVPLADTIEPVLEDGVFRNRRRAILGADDKAAVVALLHATELVVSSGEPFPTFELFFTVGEETGLLGAKYLAESHGLRSPLAAIFDASGDVGGIVVRAPSRNGVSAVFHGRAAHAGLAPEQGRSAIQAAARAVAAMQLGRVDELTTANIGIIHGGTATNIIPDLCRVEGECRSHDDKRLAEVTAGLVDAIHLGAVETGVDVECQVVNDFRSFSLKERSAPVRLAKAAIRELGLMPALLTREGASDANILNNAGLPTVNLACAMRQVHSPEECMALEDLVKLTRLVLALIGIAPDATGRRGEAE